MTFGQREADRAVRSGADWLDQEFPGWVDRIDLDEFDITFCRTCIMGQLTGLYRPRAHDETLGFRPPWDDYERVDARYARLAKAWTRTILRRRGRRSQREAE